MIFLIILEKMMMVSMKRFNQSEQFALMISVLFITLNCITLYLKSDFILEAFALTSLPELSVAVVTDFSHPVLQVF